MPAIVSRAASSARDGGGRCSAPGGGGGSILALFGGTACVVLPSLHRPQALRSWCHSLMFMQDACWTPSPSSRSSRHERQRARVAVPRHRRRGLHRLAPVRPARRAGTRGARARRPLHGRASRTSASSRSTPASSYTSAPPRTTRSSPSSCRRGGRRRAPRRRGGRAARGGEPGARDRDQRALHRGGARARRTSKKKPVLIASTSEVYGKSSALPFREDGDMQMGATDKGRWAYACSKAIDEFLAMAYWRERGAADHGRAPVQHGGTAPDRQLRDGRAEARGPGARRRAAHRVRRRPADPLLLPRRRRRPGARRAWRPRSAPTATCSTSARPPRSRSSSSPSGSST